VNHYIWLGHTKRWLRAQISWPYMTRPRGGGRCTKSPLLIEGPLPKRSNICV
jgi:hypothetical protein